jgi:broad specificity phosphatase PhoE
MRHGTTVWNEKQIIQGRSQNMLSKSGKNIVEKRAREYKDENFDFIFASPLKRTMQTANIINKEHNKKIIKDNRLIEIDQGVFAGRKAKSLTNEEKIIKQNFLKEYGLESYESVLNRTKNFLEYLTQNYKNKDILIVTHNIVASFMYKLLINEPINLKENTPVNIFNNAEIKMVEI